MTAVTGDLGPDRPLDDPFGGPSGEPPDEHWATAVLVCRDRAVDQGAWQLGVLPEHLSEDLDGIAGALRQQPGEDAFALIDVEDEFFVVVRRDGSGVRLLLSDLTAAADWDLARDVLDALELPPPSDDELDEAWPAGDLSVFADLGLDEMELGSILADDEAWADEQLEAVARALGFAPSYERVVDALSG